METIETKGGASFFNEPMNFTRGQLLASWVGLFIMGYVLAVILKKRA